MTPSGAHEDKVKAGGDGDHRARSGARHLLPHQYERLIKIVSLVAPRYFYPHRDLAQDLRISTRTLQRDMVHLRERGVRISQERGGYRFPSKRGW